MAGLRQGTSGKSVEATIDRLEAENARLCAELDAARATMDAVLYWISPQRCICTEYIRASGHHADICTQARALAQQLSDDQQRTS